MPTSSTPLAQQSAAQPVKLSPPGDTPFLRFYHTASLRTRTLAILTALEGAPDPTRYRSSLSDIVLELTDSGLEYYFLRPLDLANVGFVIKQSAHLGMGSVMRIMGPVIHNLIGRLDKGQLLIVSGHIRQLME
jgi:hypothetical protein